MDCTIVGWHIHDQAGVCEDCGDSAHVVVSRDGYATFNLCNSCLSNYNVVSDRIAEAFTQLGL